MKKLVLVCFVALLGLNISAQDTFSIIAVDPDTGEIGSAGASCVTGVGAGGIIDIITKILPGRGGVNSQAWVCIPNTNLNNAIARMEEGYTPQEIIDWLYQNDACSSQNFNPEYRQYGIADFDDLGNPRTAGFTGNMADDYKEDRQGPTYSIQGNILLDESVINNMEDNFNNTSGTLADKLMAAMQGANFAGADSRCLNAGTSSTTAYLLVYRPDDDPNDPYIRLNVGQQASGTEPIDILQDLYDQFLAVEDNNLVSKVQLFPNPVNNELHIQVDPSVSVLSYSIYDLTGKKVYYVESQETKSTFNVAAFAKGLYFLRVKAETGEISLKFVKK